MTPQRPRLLALLIVVTGLLPALAITIFFAGEVTTLPGAGVIFVSALLPPLILAALVLSETTRHVLGMAIGYGEFNLFVSLGMLYMIATLAGAGSPRADGGHIVFVLHGGFVLASVAIVVVAARHAREKFGSAEYFYWGGFVTVGGMYLVSAFAASQVVQIVEPDPRRAARRYLEVMEPLIFTIESCAKRYALAHPAAGYPRTLADMGPRGTGCLNEKTARDRVRGLVITYAPAPPSQTGYTPSFIVTARTKKTWRVPDRSSTTVFRNFASAYGDTTGFVRTAWGERPADSTSTLSPDARLAPIRACALLAREAYGHERVASSFAEMESAISTLPRERSALRGCPPEEAVRLRKDIEEIERIRAGAQTLVRPAPTHHVRYTAVAGGKDFIIEARPLSYAKTALRSYLARTGGPLHVTIEDRAATERDPIVPPCEYGYKPEFTICVAWPGLDEPQVVIRHDSVFTLDDTIRVSVRDANDPTRPADSTYLYNLACGEKQLTARLRAGNLLVATRGSELWCHPMRYRTNARAAWGDQPGTLRLTVFTIDRSGAVKRIEHHVRLTERPDEVAQR